jgi:hypothetical protein
METIMEKQSLQKSSVFLNRHDIEYFRFEEDFVEANMRCIPMIVRFKMDLAGIKLKLTEWVKFTNIEKLCLALSPANNTEQIRHYKIMLNRMIFDHTGQTGTSLEINQYPAWSVTDRVPEHLCVYLSGLNKTISSNQWKSLTNLQRFALLKLMREGHENKNFPKALREFGLA